MKTKLFFTTILIALTQFVFSQTTSIPDSNFEQALIDLGIDTDGIINGQVLTADIENVSALEVDNNNISDLTGIEDFSSLEELNCSFNQLASIDLLQNTGIVFLNLSNNILGNIDLTSLTVLEFLLIDVNQLTSLNVSQNTELNMLECGANSLTSLDVSNNLLLSDLACSNNQITNIDLSLNTDLQYLFCRENPITNLDLSSNINLFTVTLNGSPNLEMLNVANGNNQNLGALRTLNCPSLECIEVDTDIVGNIPANWEYDAGVIFSDDCENLSVNDNALSEISIFPNPTSNRLFVNTKNNIDITLLEIYSMQGQLLKTTTSKEIDVNELTAGIYFLNVQTDKGLFTKKIMKQ